MATIAQPAGRIRGDRLFYSAMALGIAALTFWGFAPTFFLSRWMTAPPTTPAWTPLLYLHGGVFTAWMLLLVVQPLLVGARNLRLHRRLGYAGAGLAAAMVVVGNAVAVRAINHGFAGIPDPVAFYAVPFFTLNAFAVTMLFAIAWRNRAEAHKRLILLANVGLVGAAIARLPFDWLAAYPIAAVFLANYIIFAGALYDWRTRGRVHPVWTRGGLAMLASQLIMVPVMGSGWWRAFAEAMASLA